MQEADIMRLKKSTYRDVEDDGGERPAWLRDFATSTDGQIRAIRKVKKEDVKNERTTNLGDRNEWNSSRG